VKGINKLIILCMAIYALAVTATAQTTWKLSKDLLATNNQISFNQGANGVVVTFCRVAPLGIFQEPTSFCLLYDEPCALNAVSLLIDGLACWRNPNSAADGSKLPIVGVNVNYAAQFPNGFGIPGRSVWVHPGVSGLGIIGWKSPITGSVNVAGFFSDLDPNCGNGIIWSVDKGNSTLTRGTIPNGGPPQTF
jgi:hypothetical protein